MVKFIEYFLDTGTWKFYSCRKSNSCSCCWKTASHHCQKGKCSQDVGWGKPCVLCFRYQNQPQGELRQMLKALIVFYFPAACSLHNIIVIDFYRLQEKRIHTIKKLRFLGEDRVIFLCSGADHYLWQEVLINFTYKILWRWRNRLSRWCNAIIKHWRKRMKLTTL